MEASTTTPTVIIHTNIIIVDTIVLSSPPGRSTQWLAVPQQPSQIVIV